MYPIDSTVLMDKNWSFLIDDYTPTTRYTGSWNSYRTTKAGRRCDVALPDYNDSNWHSVDLPHDWAVDTEFDPEALASHGFKQRGAGWYRKAFHLAKDSKDKHIVLYFEGVAGRCEVYFNGSLLEQNMSSYTEFTVDISDRAMFGEDLNVLAVRVDARDIEGWWYEGAGIYRHVWLYITDQVHFSHNGIFVKPVKGENERWSIEIESTVENSAYDTADLKIHSIIYDENRHFVASGDITGRCQNNSTGVYRQTILLDRPALWYIDDPKLYTLESELHVPGKAIETKETIFGCRTISVSPVDGFLLNGKPVRIYGTCNHQDHAGVGLALPDSLHVYRIRKLKEMGCNAYRCAHHMPAKQILDACDRIGMLVMDENRNFETGSDAREQLECMVRRDRNHPSVVFYSLFNEEPAAGTDIGKRMFKRMKSIVKRFDDTRLITGALNASTMLSDEGAALEMDITGFNYSIELFDEFHKKHPEQPVIGSENGATYSTRGCYRTDRDLHVMNSYDTEHETFFNTIRDTFRMIGTNPYIAGLFIWSGFDYRGEPAPLGWPTISSQFGLMDTCGIPKDAYYLYKAYISDKPLLHILPHWNWDAGETVKVMTVTNCEEVELFLNGVSLGRKQSDIYTQCEWQVEFIAGCLSAAAYQNGNIAARSEVRTTGKPCKIELLPDHRSILDDGMDTVPVNVCVLDENGLIVPDAQTEISFSIEGDGIVLGTGNGNPNSHERDKGSKRRLFAGWCQVLIQSAANANQLILHAEAEGVAPGLLQFQIEHTQHNQ